MGNVLVGMRVIEIEWLLESGSRIEIYKGSSGAQAVKRFHGEQRVVSSIPTNSNNDIVPLGYLSGFAF